MAKTKPRGAGATAGSWRDPAVSSRILATVRGANTQPELVLRRALRRAGLRPVANYAGVIGRPDVAFPRRRVAVFVDGDFWHGRGFRERGYASLEEQFSRWRRGEWWLAKIRSNVARDRKVTRSLRRKGWTVLRFRENAVRQSPELCASQVAAVLDSR
ncbi:MAG TPA: DUF559 domain-containing protein [Candidatus Limnocylindria bacterium]|nr:DUF559 domain-containing protein [Candidatus Limnocylindria bacterium]